MRMAARAAACCAAALPAAAAAPPAAVSVDAATSTHEVNPLYMGCHSDTGYTHQGRGFSSQLLVGESFEPTPLGASWPNSYLPAGGGANVSLQKGGLHGQTALRVRYVSGTGLAGLANRGLGNEGLYLQKGKPYDGFLFVRSEKPVTIHVAATDYTKGPPPPTPPPEGPTAPLSAADQGDLGLAGGAAVVGTPVHDTPLSVRSGNPGDHSVVVWPTTKALTPGAVVERVVFSYRYISGYCKGDDCCGGTGANLTLRVGGVPVYSSPHMTDYSYDRNQANYSAPVKVDVTGLSVQVPPTGDTRLELHIDNNDRNVQLLLPFDAEVTCGGAACASSLPRHGFGEVLAEQKLAFAGGNWTRLNFTLTPTADAVCEGIEPGSDSEVNCGNTEGRAAGHACVRCSGQLAVGLSTPGEADIDFVWFQPGEWGRLKGLPVLKDTIDTLQSIGITAIRQGGSFTDPAYYFWKNWRGPIWERPSVGATWGKELISSWGPFEMIDMCEAAGFEPIIDTTAQNGGCCQPEDMADLVEYCWGNETTKWGAQRHADGHARPYPLHFVELGNEQYNSLYIDQVKAMEERAKAVGKGGELYYIFPNNGHWMKDADGDRAEALGMGDHLVEDFHVGGGGAVAGSEKLFAGHASWHEGSLNLETNAGIHSMSRAMMEAEDLNAFFTQHIPSTSGDRTGRIKARTASFCTERSGHYDAFDQGITFFLPNGSWIQPPGYVHKMIHETWLPQAVPVNATGLSVSAQRAADGSQVRLLVANTATNAVSAPVTLRGFRAKSAVAVTTLSAGDDNAANPPGQPDLVGPVSSAAELPNGGTLTVPARSFTVVVFDAA